MALLNDKAGPPVIFIVSLYHRRTLMSNVANNRRRYHSPGVVRPLRTTGSNACCHHAGSLRRFLYISGRSLCPPHASPSRQSPLSSAGISQHQSSLRGTESIPHFPQWEILLFLMKQVHLPHGSTSFMNTLDEPLGHLVFYFFPPPPDRSIENVGDAMVFLVPSGTA